MVIFNLFFIHPYDEEGNDVSDKPMTIESMPMLTKKERTALATHKHYMKNKAKINAARTERRRRQRNEQKQWGDEICVYLG